MNSNSPIRKRAIKKYFIPKDMFLHEATLFCVPVSAIVILPEIFTK